MSPDTLCACFSGNPYAECCQPYHNRQALASNASDLMRSRYSAFILSKSDYIIDTTHRENHEYIKNTVLWKMRLNAYCKTLQGVGLEIAAYEPGETKSYVTFIAQLTVKGKPVKIHEKSLFLKVGNRWLYHSGEYQ